MAGGFAVIIPGVLPSHFRHSTCSSKSPPFSKPSRCICFSPLRGGSLCVWRRISILPEASRFVEFLLRAIDANGMTRNPSSHANVHSSNRPHYCPVKTCNRSEGGRGFKRKNEMIRHGLVHQSPGYICPFCPEREHKYPRPDNLQRYVTRRADGAFRADTVKFSHVRVHHVDKDKDDPLLRDVLAQRPEGGARGRRRRVNS